MPNTPFPIEPYIINRYPTPSEALLQTLEETIGAPLPTDYRSFLLRCNGTTFPKSVEVVWEVASAKDATLDENLPIDWLYPLMPPDYTRGVIERAKSFPGIMVSRDIERFSCIMLPVGRSDVGDICLAYAGPDVGSVWFWDSFATPDEIEDSFDRLANTFCEFLTNLIATPKEPESQHPLFQAIERGDCAEIERMLREGVSPNERNEGGQPAILVAAECRQVEALRTLLEGAADLGITGAFGRTALHEAAGSPDIVRLLLARSADLEAHDERGFTPLMTGVSSRSPYTVEILLQAGCSTAPVFAHEGLCKCVRGGFNEGDATIWRLLKEYSDK